MCRHIPVLDNIGKGTTDASHEDLCEFLRASARLVERNVIIRRRSLRDFRSLCFLNRYKHDTEIVKFPPSWHNRFVADTLFLSCQSCSCSDLRWPSFLSSQSNILDTLCLTRSPFRVWLLPFVKVGTRFVPAYEPLITETIKLF